MEREGEIQCRSVLGHGLEVALRGKDEYLVSIEIELDVVQEVNGIGLRVVQDFFDGLQPLGQLALVLASSALFVLPVGGEALFGHVVHPLTAYLHLYPLAVVAHKGDVQGLVSVRFRMAYPVAQAVWMRFVNLGNGHVNVEAVVQFLFQVAWGENDAHGQQVVNLLEGHMLGLHLVPDGVDGLDTCQDMILQSHLVQFHPYGSGKFLEHLVTLSGRSCQLVLYHLIFLGMLVLEAQVLQLGLNLIQPQPIGKRGVDIKRLPGYLVLLVGQHGPQRAHVVQPVGYFL